MVDSYTVTPPGGSSILTDVGNGANPDDPIGSNNAPITQQQLASLYGMPNAAGIGSAISGTNTNYTSPLAGLTTINTGNTGQVYGQQQAQIGQLQALASGSGPSLAALQAQQSGQQNLANEAALIASQRGGAGNTALGLRSAADQAAATAQQTQQAAVQGRTAEQLGAEGVLSNALSTAGSQQAQQAQAQAQLQQNTALANLTAQLQTGKLNAQQYNAMVQELLGASAQQQQGQEAYGQLVNNSNITLQQMNNAANQVPVQQALGFGSAALNAAGSVGAKVATSDKTLKTNIKSGNKNITDFLNTISKSDSNFNMWK